MDATTERSVIDAYKKGTTEERNCLRRLFPELISNSRELKSVTERVRTFYDALDELGEEHPYVKMWNNAYHGGTDWGADRDIADVVAYLKLRIITAALNEGWNPTYNQKDEQWYPYFSFYSEDELKCLKCQKDLELKAIYSIPGYEAETDYIVYMGENSYCNESDMCLNSHLCFKSEELANYCAEQFIDIYADYFLTRKNNETI
jgi:hypothetical protein